MAAGDADLRLEDGFGYRPTTPAKTDTQVTQALHRLQHCKTCGGSGHLFIGPIWNPLATCPTCAGMGMVVAGEAGKGE